GRARCADLPADAEARAAATIAGLPEGMRASMLDDLERGKPLELQSLSGTVARLAAAHGIAAPTHDLVARALYPYAQGAPSQAPARAPAQAPSEAPS
ncbi:MAG: ketopantoate reductase C-terminal domain-containing protein, partial [Pseudomonadota bacterium]